MAGAVLGLVAVAIGVPLGIFVRRVLADAVSAGIGVGPGWLPAPSIGLVSMIATIAIGLSAMLGAVATRRTATRPAADLVRGE